MTPVNYPDNNISIVDPWLSTDSDKFKKEAIDFIGAYYTHMKQLFNIELADLVKYFRESKYSGYPEEPGGSVFKSEGQFIYVMIRHIKPKSVLEIGNFKGRGSTNHILQAIDDNKMGEVTLIDIEERLEYDRLHSKKFTRLLQDSLKFLEQPFSYDLIVHDGCHEYLHVKKELELMAKNSTQDFWLWSHDYYKILPPQCEVKRAWDESWMFYQKITPMIDAVSNCGFVVAQKKK